MLALGMLTAASSRIRFQEFFDQFPPYTISICMAPGIQFILGLYECRVGPVPRPYKVVHRCGLDKEMAMTKKSLVQQIFFVTCDTYGRYPTKIPRSSVLIKYAAPYKLKILTVNQLHNCYVLREHCYILSNISQ